MSWQPIETAPKDGQHLLLWHPWTGRQLKSAPPGFVYLARWLVSDDGLDRWIEPYDGETIGEGATHWSPLPSPPPTGR